MQIVIQVVFHLASKVHPPPVATNVLMDSQLKASRQQTDFSRSCVKAGLKQVYAC